MRKKRGREREKWENEREMKREKKPGLLQRKEQATEMIYLMWRCEPPPKIGMYFLPFQRSSYRFPPKLPTRGGGFQP